MKYFLLFLLCFFTFELNLTAANATLKDEINEILNYEANTDHINLRREIWYGNASWYGKNLHGRITSNGEKFNKNDLTAAHKTLPFNTKVLVTNLKTNKSVKVRINDRGPFKPNRIIDLSEEAADKIEIKNQGIAFVKLQVIAR